MVSEDQCADAPQHSIQRKDSKLRRAVTFFKHLGLKGCSRHKTSGALPACDIGSLDKCLTKRQRSEMEDTSHDISNRRAELANSSNDAHGRGSYNKRQEETVYEMEDSTIATSQGSEHPLQHVQETNSTFQPCELDVEPLITVGIGAQFEVTPHDSGPMEMLVSPASVSDCPFAHQSAESSTRYYELESAIPKRNGPDIAVSPEPVDNCKYQIDVAQPYSELPLSSENDGSISNAVTLSTHAQIKELCETVCVLNEEWLQRCQSTPDLLFRASALTPRSLLEEGTQTLQLIFQGVVPKTFDAIFALTHVACSAAYISHGNDSTYHWNLFFQQVLKLQDLIQNGGDAQIFVQLVNLLWWPQCSSAQRFCGNYFLDEGSGTLVPLRKRVIGPEGLPSTGIEAIDMQAPYHPTDLALTRILNSLKDGPVVQECSRFLDGKLVKQHSSNKSKSDFFVGVEYASISERSKTCPTHLPWYAQNHVTNIQDLLMTIICPLQHCAGIEALHGAINCTAKDLSSGSLRSVREVEVSLISNGQVRTLRETQLSRCPLTSETI